MAAAGDYNYKKIKTISLILTIFVFSIGAFVFQPERAKAEITIFYSAAGDGHITETEFNNNYNDAWVDTQGDTISGSSISVGQVPPIPPWQGYQIIRGFLYFDTSSLPDDAEITNATLSLYGQQNDSDADFNLTVQSGMPTYPRDPLVREDYNKNYYSGNGGEFNTAGFTSSGYNDIVLNSTGRGWINKAGWTKFAIRSSKDISGTPPVQSEWVKVRASESGEGYRPKLTIIYTQPISFPVVTTDLADVDLENNEATLRGTITDTGGEDVDQISFHVGTISGIYPDSWTKSYTGDFSDTAPLTPGTIYYYKVQAHNSAGWSGLDNTNERRVVIYNASGGQKEFTTLSGDEISPEVTAFDVIPKDPDWVNNSSPDVDISWTVTDLGGSHLGHIEVWRAPDSGGVPGTWEKIGSDYPAPADSDSWSSNTIDSPYNGIWWYGLHILDNAGNMGVEPDPPGPIKVLVDKTNPFSGVTYPTNGSWHRDDFTATLDDSDAGGSGLTASCQYMIDDLANDKHTGILSRDCDPVDIDVKVGTLIEDICAEDRLEPIGQPSCKVSTKSFDNAGNDSGWQSRNFNIDFTPPIIGEISSLTATQGVEETFSASVMDAVGKISGCWLYVDNWSTPVSADISIFPIPCENGADCTVSADYTFTSSGDYEMRFSCKDYAGNFGWGEPITVNVAEGLNPHAPIITSLDYYTCDCSTPETECDSQFNCCLEPTTQGNEVDGCCIKFDVEAADPDGDTLTYSWNFDDGGSSSEEDPAYHYDNPADYIVIVTVSDGTEFANKGIVVSVSDPSVSVNLSASPAFGIGSLEDVSLRAIVSGSMYGTINYKFDCTNDGPWESEIFNQTIQDYSAYNLCDYSEIGVYNAKVLVERGEGGGEDTTEIKVVDTECTPGETTSCTSPQGCGHIITCKEEGVWPVCPSDSDECTAGEIQSCGLCASKTCTVSCVWGDCFGGGVCTPGPDSSECPCPPSDGCEYPLYGVCNAFCSCESCEPIQCNESPACDSLEAVPASIMLGEGVVFTGYGSDSDGTISQYEFDFGDDSSKAYCPDNPDCACEADLSWCSVGYVYNTAGNFCSKLRVQDNEGDWSDSDDCGCSEPCCAQQITVTENQAPSATNLSANTYSGNPDYHCSAFYPPVNLSWIFDDLDPDDVQLAYQVQIDDSSDFSSIENDSEYVESFWNEYSPNNLSFGTTYYWRVRVWDISGLRSDCGYSDGWCYPETPELPYFHTETRYPIPDFDWNPKSPVAGELIQFCSKKEGDCLEMPEDKQVEFFDSNPEARVWEWDFNEDGITDSYAKNPVYSYSEENPQGYTVYLKVTDGAGNGPCEASVNISVRKPLPEWQEIPPI